MQDESELPTIPVGSCRTAQCPRAQTWGNRDFGGLLLRSTVGVVWEEPNTEGKQEALNVRICSDSAVLKPEILLAWVLGFGAPWRDGKWVKTGGTS